MGRFNTRYKQTYWMSRVLDTLPDPPPKETPFSELTDEQKVARYLHRAYYIMTGGEKFSKKAFRDMMRPPE